MNINLTPKGVLQWAGTACLICIGCLAVWWIAVYAGFVSAATPESTTIAPIVKTDIVVSSARTNDLTVVDASIGHYRRDTVGKPDPTEWLDLAKKVDKPTPNWLVPVQVLEGVPHLVCSDEVGVIPKVVVPDAYRDLYRWHQVSPAEADMMNVCYGKNPSPTLFQFVDPTKRFMGKVWVLERNVLPTGPAVDLKPVAPIDPVPETAGGKIDVTAAPEKTD